MERENIFVIDYIESLCPEPHKSLFIKELDLLERQDVETGRNDPANSLEEALNIMYYWDEAGCCPYDFYLACIQAAGSDGGKWPDLPAAAYKLFSPEEPDRDIEMDEVYSEMWDEFMRNPRLRTGQNMFNALYRLCPGVANQIRGTELDPFFECQDCVAMFDKIEQLLIERKNRPKGEVLGISN
jgi:hypothetical protein